MFEVSNKPDSDISRPAYSHGTAMVVPTLIMPLSIIAVLLRCWVKKRILNLFSLDDWLLLLTLILFMILCSMVIYTVSIGFGTHSDKLSDDALYTMFLVGYPNVQMRVQEAKMFRYATLKRSSMCCQPSPSSSAYRYWSFD